METFFRYTAPPSACGYLSDRQWSLEYEMVTDITAWEYSARLLAGWRRFGGSLFRPQCPMCRACQSLRVDISNYQLNRSQRRALKANSKDVDVRVSFPSVSREKLDLYDRFHEFQSDFKGWPQHPAKEPVSYHESFVNNPEFTEEWTYYLGDRLIGVSYVDHLPIGMSAIYFFYDPDVRERSLGTFNVVRLLEECKRRGAPHLYLGYYVEGCRSLEYKATFRPNQILHADGQWRDFLS